MKYRSMPRRCWESSVFRGELRPSMFVPLTPRQQVGRQGDKRTTPVQRSNVIDKTT